VLSPLERHVRTLR